MKSKVLITSAFLLATNVYSQVRVESNGSFYVNSGAANFGRANWTRVHSIYTCAYHLWNNYFNQDVFYVRGDGYAWTMHGWLTTSDSTSKSNIRALENSLDKILKLQGVTYNLKYLDGIESIPGFSKNREIGLIAQDVEKILPEVVVNMSDSLKAINYQAIIPLLIESIKELNTKSENLQRYLLQLESELAMLKECCNRPEIQIDKNSNSFKSQLYQNVPNPSLGETEIKYHISSSAKNSQILIHSINGREVKVYNNLKSGHGSIVVSDKQIEPGIYIYTLIVDYVVIDTRRMILTR